MVTWMIKVTGVKRMSFISNTELDADFSVSNVVDRCVKTAMDTDSYNFNENSFYIRAWFEVDYGLLIEIGEDNHPVLRYETMDFEDISMPIKLSAKAKAYMSMEFEKFVATSQNEILV